MWQMMGTYREWIKSSRGSCGLSAWAKTALKAVAALAARAVGAAGGAGAYLV